ncbi:MAG: hypothetical protein QOJ73_4327, partial [Streptosporangiaceae bacterium]|nr:hypothetical protein [Streptosporangiaceae bacterium]
MASHSSLARRARPAVAGDQAVLTASAHLTERDRYLVRTVADHRVLTTGQLCALGFDSIITARHRLGVLTRLGVLRRFRPRRDTGSAPWHYILGPVGAALLGAEDRDERKWLPQVRTDRQLALERSQRLGHITGTNWFFVSLARHARQGGGELRAWAGESRTAEYFYGFALGARSLDALPHPDGLGIWAEHGRDIVFLLEYDTGSEHLPQLTGKLHRYAELAGEVSHAEQVSHPLLFCFPGPRREQSARRALAATADAGRLRIATAALDPRLTCPAGPAWMPLHGGHRHPVRLIDLETAMPDPMQLAREQEKRELAAERARQRRPGSYGTGTGSE